MVCTDLLNVDWGENEDTIGLTKKRFVHELGRAFQNVPSDFQSHWWSNPEIMTDDVVKGLPPTSIAYAELDGLALSLVNFVKRLEAQGMVLNTKGFPALHQMKEMYQTRASIEMWDWITGEALKMVNRVEAM